MLIALCAELRARKSETAPLEDVARRLARLVALAGDAGDSSRPPTHGELLEIVDRFADDGLFATRTAQAGLPLRAAAEHPGRHLADVRGDQRHPCGNAAAWRRTTAVNGSGIGATPA